jgi:TolB protein
VHTDGSGLIETWIKTDAAVSDLGWSPDGTRLVFEHLIVRGGHLTTFVIDVSKEESLMKRQDNIEFHKPILLSSKLPSPAWSSDDKLIASLCGDIDLGFDICVMPAPKVSTPMNAAAIVQTNLTNAAGNDENPVWSPDETRLAFVSTRDGDAEIYVMNADGSGQINLTNHPADDTNPAWSPDGTWIAFQSTRDEPEFWDCLSCNYEIYVMNADGSGQTRLTNNSADDILPVWAPK